jgi:hypothetical protein
VKKIQFISPKFIKYQSLRCFLAIEMANYSAKHAPNPNILVTNIFREIYVVVVRQIKMGE